jgi:DNA-3-methyladenine glycosylase
MAVLPRSFFDRDVVELARTLVGKTLRRGPVALRITETEAYRWPGDTACHARVGRTPRTEPLWGPPGRAYVYLCYGLHNMLNIVAGGEADAAAVLIRACEPLEGLAVVRRRRGGQGGPTLLTGPGKVGAALALDTGHSGDAVYRGGASGSGLRVEDGPVPAHMLVGTRIGIDYALPEHRALPWRFAAADTPWVTHRRGLLLPSP